MSRLEELLKEYKELGISDQIDYDKFYLYSIITHSTAIEGSTVTEIENQLMFDEGISPAKPLAEQLMNLDLKNAYEEGFRFAESRRDYSVEALCRLSSLVMKNTGSFYNTLAGSFDSSKGELRLLNVSAGAGGRSYMAWQKVPDRIKEFCVWINDARKKANPNDVKKIYALSYEAHYRLVHIHPWADGNGRMSRLVMNMIQYEFGVVPSIVKKSSRADYIKSLEDTREKDDVQIFISFMTKTHEENIAEQIQEYKDSINDTIKPPDDTINDTINPAGISKTVGKVFKEIIRDTSITIDQIVDNTGLSRPTVTRAISTLKEKGLIGRDGSRKTGVWIVNTERGQDA